MSAGKGRGRPPGRALGDVDLSGLPAPLAGGNDPAEMERRRGLALRLESPEFLVQSASAGIVKVVRPAVPPPGPLPAPSRRKLRSDEPNFTVRLPEEVQQAIRLRAVMEKTTVRLILLRALRAAGFEVAEQDMTDDRGIVAKQRSRDRQA
jgi:hypothetical protein